MLTFRYLLTVVAAVAATAGIAAAVLGMFNSSQAPLVSAAASIAAGKAAHLDAPVGVGQYLAYYSYVDGRWVLNDAGGIPVYVLVLGQCRPSLLSAVNTTSMKTTTFKGNGTLDIRSTASLKVIDLTDYWRQGYASVTVYVNPAMSPSFTLTAPVDAFADYLLAWEDCLTCDPTYSTKMYDDQVWRLTFTSTGPVLTQVFINTDAGYWHKVYADGQLIYTWRLDGPKNTVYVGTYPTITVAFASPDSAMNATATFTVFGIQTQTVPSTFRNLLGKTYTAKNATIALTGCVLVMPWVEGNVVTHYAATCRSGTDFRPETVEMTSETPLVRVRLVVVNC